MVIALLNRGRDDAYLQSLPPSSPCLTDVLAFDEWKELQFQDAFNVCAFFLCIILSSANAAR